MARNPLAELAGGVTGLIRDRIETRRKEEEAIKLRQSLIGVTSGFQRQSTLQQKLAAGVPLAEAQAQTETAMKGFVPEEDPRYKYLTAQQLDPTTIINLARFLYQAPRIKAPTRIIHESRRIGKGWEKSKKTAFEKWKKSTVERETQLRKAESSGFAPEETIQKLREQVASWEREGVRQGFLKPEETVYTTQFIKEREMKRKGVPSGRLPGLTP